MSGREAVKLARQSGAIRLAKKPVSFPGQQIAAAPLSITVFQLLTYLAFSITEQSSNNKQKS